MIKGNSINCDNDDKFIEGKLKQPSKIMQRDVMMDEKIDESRG